MQLTTKEDGKRHVATRANMKEEMNWNAHAKTRMDWGNNSHVLETFAMHGGAEILKDYMTMATGPGSAAVLR